VTEPPWSGEQRNTPVSREAVPKRKVIAQKKRENIQRSINSYLVLRLRVIKRVQDNIPSSDFVFSTYRARSIYIFPAPRRRNQLLPYALVEKRPRERSRAGRERRSRMLPAAMGEDGLLRHRAPVRTLALRRFRHYGFPGFFVKPLTLHPPPPSEAMPDVSWAAREA
jgi:hypothetical protein